MSAFEIPADTTIRSLLESVAPALHARLVPDEAPVDATRSRRAEGLATLVLAAGVLCTSGCHGHASLEDCRSMSEHYIDLALKESPGSATLSAAQASAVRDVERGLKRAEPTFRAVQDRCAEVTRAEVSCGVDATSTRAWEACLGDAGR
ncbi:MAG TPA: hypothetical protein VH044_03565 [Polyangiaceae bacterium]|nr:hypothetical protein [Polyangiaceae bacterium]